MSSGHYCVIRGLGLVKGGKGLRHHEVVLQLSCRGLFAFAKSVLLEYSQATRSRLARRGVRQKRKCDADSNSEVLGFLVERGRRD